MSSCCRCLQAVGDIGILRWFGHPLAPASHFHSHALAEVIVHLVVAAHRAGAEMIGFCRENAVALSDGHQTLFPDSAFQLVRRNGERLSYSLRRTPTTVGIWESSGS